MVPLLNDRNIIGHIFRYIIINIHSLQTKNEIAIMDINRKSKLVGKLNRYFGNINRSIIVSGFVNKVGIVIKGRRKGFSCHWNNR